MQQLHLHIGEELQAKFCPKKLNLLLIFQVNCPGCFIYALPIFQEIFMLYKERIGFIALSTAFEDYELNTTENTRLLIEKGALIGETKKALLPYEYHTLPYAIDFPIAMDGKMKDSQKNTVTENICHINPDFSSLQEDQKNLIRQRVSKYLSVQTETSLTFTTNQFRGTPTIVLFNEEHKIIDTWFGHTKKETLLEKINSIINKG